jgi:hypothetical protein
MKECYSWPRIDVKNKKFGGDQPPRFNVRPVGFGTSAADPYLVE